MCGGNGASTDRSQELQNYGRLDAAGADNADAGAANTGSASKYFSSVLSGDPTAVASAAAPVTNQVNAEENQQKSQISNFGNRSGGTNDTTQQMATNGIGKISDTVAGVRGQAAGALGQIGGGQTGAGVDADKALGEEATYNRKESNDQHNASVNQWADVASTLLLG
jgi:hypothetical protein